MFNTGRLRSLENSRWSPEGAEGHYAQHDQAVASGAIGALRINVGSIWEPGNMKSGSYTYHDTIVERIFLFSCLGRTKRSYRMIEENIGLYSMIMGLNVLHPENRMLWKNIHESSTCRHPFNAEQRFSPMAVP